MDGIISNILESIWYVDILSYAKYNLWWAIDLEGFAYLLGASLWPWKRLDKQITKQIWSQMVRGFYTLCSLHYERSEDSRTDDCLCHQVWPIPNSQLERESSSESTRLPPGLGCHHREQNVIFCHYHITDRKSEHISYLALYTLANHKSLDAAIQDTR